METRARHILIGVFLLAVSIGAFAFVYWLHDRGGLGERAIYRVSFESSVSGLRHGSAVLFNGVHVGQVTGVRLDEKNPRLVIAAIAVERGTPVRADTQVRMDFQGLMGSPSISLVGGSIASPALTASPGEPPTLMADPAATEDLSRIARGVLQRLESVLAENADGLRRTVADLSTFANALARNSDRLDPILAGLERFISGGDKKPLPIYDLSVPGNFSSPPKAPQGQLIVAEPTALVAFDTQRILLRGEAGEKLPFENAQWSDALPKLLQAKIIQAFENTGYLSGVGRPMDGLTADHQLFIDIRDFQVSVSPKPSAQVELSARIADAAGQVIGTRTFRATTPVKASDAPAAVVGLDHSFQQVVRELVDWTSNTI